MVVIGGIQDRDVVDVLKSIRMGVIIEEFEIHDEIKRVLQECGVEYNHEYRLGKGSRADFYCPEERIIIEVKKGKPDRKRLENQIRRYASYEEVNRVVVVSERIVKVPEEVEGKPCDVVDLHSLWF